MLTVKEAAESLTKTMADLKDSLSQVDAETGKFNRKVFYGELSQEGRGLTDFDMSLADMAANLIDPNFGQGGGKRKTSLSLIDLRR